MPSGIFRPKPAIELGHADDEKEQTKDPVASVRYGAGGEVELLLVVGVGKQAKNIRIGLLR